MYFSKFPKYMEIMEMKKLIKNKIDLAPMVIFVFLIPYVIPIPRESILLEIDKNKQLSNIKTPLPTSYEYNKKMLKIVIKIDYVNTIRKTKYKIMSIHFQYFRVRWYILFFSLFPRFAT